MTLDVRINSQSLKSLLNGPPSINDQLNGACRTLDIPVQNADSLLNYLGQPVELWYGGKRWYYGFLVRRSFDSDGKIKYMAYDPLWYLSRNPGDFYIKQMTATQGIKYLAEETGIPVRSVANTGTVLANKYYQNAQPDKIMIDLLARTYQANGKNFWYRFSPYQDSFGLHVFERKVPSEVWAFQAGINLTAASYEDTIEETATIVKLVNRETGKVVTKLDKEKVLQFGNLVHFQEVDKEQSKTMEKLAQETLAKLSKVKTSIKVDGVNPDQVIPQLYSGDVIYVEEANTGLLGAYHIRNIRQVFEGDQIVRLGMDVQLAPDIPTVQYENAKDKKTEQKEPAKEGTGVQDNQQYGEKMNQIIDKFGIK